MRGFKEGLASLLDSRDRRPPRAVGVPFSRPRRRSSPSFSNTARQGSSRPDAKRTPQGWSTAPPNIHEPIDHEGVANYHSDNSVEEEDHTDISTIPEIDSNSKDASFGHHELEARPTNSVRGTAGSQASQAHAPSQDPQAPLNDNDTILSSKEVKRYVNELNRIEKIIREVGTTVMTPKQLDSMLRSNYLDNVLRVVFDSYTPIIEEKDRLTVQIEKACKKGGVSDKSFVEAFKNNGNEGALALVIQRLDTLKTSVARLELERKDHQNAMSELTRSKNLAIANIDRDWEKRLETQKAKAAEELQRSQTRARMELNASKSNFLSLQAEQLSVMESAEDQHKKALLKESKRYEELKEKMRIELQELAFEHETQEKELRAMAKEAEALMAKHQRDTDELKQQCESKLDELRKEMEALNTTHQREINELREHYEAKLHELRKEMEKVKGILQQREHTKGLSDQEIASFFKKLARSIDSFSRVAWDKQKQSQWPIADGLLQRAENTKKLKQLIIQTDVWLILNEYIFQLPFAIFRDEGKRLHDQWVEEFGPEERGESPAWANASQESETRRCDFIKQFTEASKNPRTLTDMIRRLVKAHEETVESTVNKIHRAVNTIGTSELARVQEIVNFAAEFWVKSMGQKYRIRLHFPPEATESLGTTRKGKVAGMQLIEQPELRRRGNALGERLEREQAVSGCEKEFKRSEDL